MSDDDPAARPLTLTADMVANVISVEVAAGDEVEEGQTLLVVESMKMEIPITSPTGGTVTAVGVAVGDIVQEGDAMVSIRR